MIIKCGQPPPVMLLPFRHCLPPMPLPPCPWFPSSFPIYRHTLLCPFSGRKAGRGLLLQVRGLRHLSPAGESDDGVRGCPFPPVWIFPDAEPAMLAMPRHDRFHATAGSSVLRVCARHVY